MASRRFMHPVAQSGHSPPAAFLHAHPLHSDPFQDAESLMTCTPDKQ